MATKPPTVYKTSDPPRPLLVSFGNPLLDITAVVNDDSLHQEFNLPIDGQLEANKDQRILFKRVLGRYPVEYTAGGCALNSSRVFCWVLGETERVVFIGGIGKDDKAKRLTNIVQDSGVVTRLIEVEDQPTGSCIALVLGACRCLCADIGAASVCEPQHVFNPQILPIIEEAKFIYVEGYFITHSFETALQIAKYARKNNKMFIFNLCGSYVCENHPIELSKLLPLVDIIFGYVEEYKALNKFVNIKQLSEHVNSKQSHIMHDMLLVLNAIKGEENVIKDHINKKDCSSSKRLQMDEHINRGGCDVGVNSSSTNDFSPKLCANGSSNAYLEQDLCLMNGHESADCDESNECNKNSDSNESSNSNCRLSKVIIGNGSSQISETTQKFQLVVVTNGPSPLLYVKDGIVRERDVPPIKPADIVDTTGAGDSFVGGFLAALSKGEPIDRCLDCGTWTAQQLLQQKGCTIPHFPSTFLSA